MSEHLKKRFLKLWDIELHPNLYTETRMIKYALYFMEY